ncbi:MAG: MchE protein [Planctomycetota bacterium]|nr:MchE protein [Planctomycetota bacterium]MDA1248571.1 MchE protein [Planctomycetota bacterium]
MRISKSLRILSGVAVVAALGAGAFFTRERWMPRLVPQIAEAASAEGESPPVEEPKVLKLSPQARKNMGLVSKPVRPQTYWKKVQIPGEIVDRPGRSDRGITSPAVGVVTQIHAFPGDTVKPGDRLFTLRLFSEYLQNTQKELFGATRETQLIDEQLKRLRPLAETGGIAKSKIIELESQLQRQEAAISAHRQDLLTRGLNLEQIASVAAGKFVVTVEVVAPPPAEANPKTTEIQPAALQLVQGEFAELAYEVQELTAELGQQVQAGQLLSTLANHRSLYVEGHAFKRDAPALEDAAQGSRDIAVEFAEDNAEHWPVLEQAFRIRHLSNSIDTSSRTFDFFIPLTNQSRNYQQDGQTFIVWRFRPGQRVRLHVPVENLDNVIVLPAEAVVREGPEAYVFRQNGDLFNRIPVQVLHEDRLNIVLANDGSMKPGLYFAQNAAASLNRVLKAQAASGMRADVHVHADGTVHASH